MEAIRRLASEGADCCRFHRMITDADSWGSQEHEAQDVTDSRGTDNVEGGDLNESQRNAVRTSQNARVSLIWGPPGELLIIHRLWACVQHRDLCIYQAQERRRSLFRFSKD